MVGLFTDLMNGLKYGLVLGLMFGLSGWIISCLFAALRTQQPSERRITSNDGIRRSTWSAVLSGLVAGLAVGLVLGLFAWLVYKLMGGLAEELVTGLAVGLLGGLVIGLGVALFKGGNAVIRHYSLRLVLKGAGVFPWRAAGFLDYCVARGLMRRVGGGWVFIHRILLDHFAEQA